MNDHDLITTMRESFTDVQSATPVEQIVSRGQVIRARRRIPGAATAVAVAAAAGITVALIPSGSARPAPVAMQTTAYVVSHVTRALDAMPADTVVVMQRTGFAGDRTESWSNEGQSRLETFTRAGQPVGDNEIAVSGTATRMTRRIVDVDYQNKTWWRAVQYLPEDGRPVPARVWTCGNVESDDIVGNPHEMVGQLRTALSCGDLKVVGSGTVGGVATVKLSGDFNGGGTVTYWVNATTYLPFRFTSAIGGGRTFQINLQWLPPTAANLAKVNVPIPAGFTQVPPPGNASSS